MGGEINMGLLKNLTDERSDFERIMDEYKSGEYKPKQPIVVAGNVIVFKSMGTRFAIDLAEYLKNHPSTKIISIVPSMTDTGVHGESTMHGYIVVIGSQ
jgi:hypothetical protein